MIGLRRTNTPAPNPNTLRAQGFDLLGTLKPNPKDGLADFVVLREPSPLEGPREPRARPLATQPDSRAARFSS